MEEGIEEGHSSNTGRHIGGKKRIHRKGIRREKP
jgi:hypothetical protein